MEQTFKFGLAVEQCILQRLPLRTCERRLTEFIFFFAKKKTARAVNS